MIPEKEVVLFIRENKKYIERNHMSFFEMTVAMAFEYFSKENG